MGESDSKHGPTQEGSSRPDPAPSPKPIHSLLTPARIATTARVVLILGCLLAFGYLARAVVLPVLLAGTLAMTLKAPMRWLARVGLPAPLAAALIVGLFVAGMAAAAIHLGRPAMEWLSRAPEQFPGIRAKFQHVLRPAARLSEAASSVGHLTVQEPEKRAPMVEVQDNHVANTVFTWTGSLLAGATETVALLFLILAAGDLFLQKLVRAIPRLRDKKQAVDISREIQQSVSTYLFAMGLINLALGAAVGIVLHLLGVPNAAMWGGVAAFANFIPYIGPILGMTAIGIAGLLAFDTVGRGLMPAGAYCALHLIETYAVTPFVLGRRFALNPVLIFIALIFCAWLWGVIGALLAVPLLVIAKVVCDRIPDLNFVGELLSAHHVPEAARESREVSPPPVADAEPVAPGPRPA